MKMAAASSNQAAHFICEANLGQRNNLDVAVVSCVDYNGDTYQPVSPTSHTSSQSSTLSSRSCSSGDGVSYSSSIESEIDSPHAKIVGRSHTNDIMIDSSLFDCAKENHNIQLNSNGTITLNGVKCCKACKTSRSDTVARCFECASYMTSNRALESGMDNGGDSKIDTGAVLGRLGDIAGRCNNGEQDLLHGSGGVGGVFDNIWPERLHATGLTSSAVSQFVGGISINPYDIWCANSTNPLPNSAHLLNTLAANINSNAVSDPSLDLRSKLLCAVANPTKITLKRLMMIYHCKFGEFGVTDGQFTEPSGVAVNAQSYIIVADTNNHRIQIFDKEGHFKFQFGECGKRDSQLLYPNRVAVSRLTGDIVVTERSPTHQVQIFNQYGQFIRKFGANILQHPRGLTVDNQGRIIVVECKVMRVVIFDQMGNVLHKFGCNKHLRFPNGVAVNEREEIFISDNRAHCVKVFNYEGLFLRQIGGEGLTNYPIGVCINANGEILIADNHNNFNLTIFTQDGQFVSAHESRVKHAQCFDVALIDDGSVVLASKDYRIYLYRYAPIALPLGLQ